MKRDDPMKDDPMPGSVFQAQDSDLTECHEIVEQYSPEAIQMAAAEVKDR